MNKKIVFLLYGLLFGGFPLSLYSMERGGLLSRDKALIVQNSTSWTLEVTYSKEGSGQEYKREIAPKSTFTLPSMRGFTTFFIHTANLIDKINQTIRENPNAPGVVVTVSIPGMGMVKRVLPYQFKVEPATETGKKLPEDRQVLSAFPNAKGLGAAAKPYQILGVPANSTLEDIKEAHATLVREWLPVFARASGADKTLAKNIMEYIADAHKALVSEQKFKELQETTAEAAKLKGIALYEIPTEQ